MGIFDRLKHAILGEQTHTQTAQPGPASPASASASPAPNSARAGAAAVQTPGSGQPKPQPAAQSAATAGNGGRSVDVEAVLKQLAAKKHEPLNWQSSIVDLMKVVDLDPSLENRKTLAKELGYTGDTHDSAAMNVWLHRQVMQNLAASGGKIPDSLRH